MESNYESKYSGEQVDAAVEYFLNHSSAEEQSYVYPNTIFCKSDTTPALPFNASRLPIDMPDFPFAGTDGKPWYDVPNASGIWWQCTIKINNKSNKVVSLGTVLAIQGEKGDTGTSGTDGENGKDGKAGKDGDNGDYIEFRYKRASSYAIVLTEDLMATRYPEGWYLNWDNANVETYDTIKSSIITDFDAWLRNYSSVTTASTDASKFFTELGIGATYKLISDLFTSIYKESLTVTEQLLIIIVACYKDYKELYDTDTSTIVQVEYNDLYHLLYTKYIDEDHIWLLFLIYATIDGNTNLLKTSWSSPNRILGENGKPGPAGSNGVSGTPGVNISVAFTLGTETEYRKDAANPLEAPYNTNYNALFADGTYWTKGSPDITDTYPYIWFTQCRYIKDGDTYTFEDVWSKPLRYTGVNGITKSETVYVRNPIIYPAGIWASNTSYSNDGYKAPYVYYEGNYYYVSGLGTAPVGSTPNTTSTWWTLLEGFEALYTKVGIIANGLIGSIVFNGDYVFSQLGVDNTGATSTHYEWFLTNYSTGEPIEDPYDDNAKFKPNFCLNCKTGKVWSTSRDEAISTASAEILAQATSISMKVKEDINGELKSAGIDITPEGVTVTGDFIGTANGAFKGDVSAESFSVIGDDGLPVLLFTTYDSSMGTPSGGTTPEEGTPVFIITFNGKRYIINMLELQSGGSSVTYKLVAAVTSSITIADSIALKTGVQGSTIYNKITTAPYLVLLNEDGSETTTKIAAKLYASDGTTEVLWSAYMNRYYTGTLVSEYSDKTDLSNGVWAFKVTGALANATGYNGTPKSKMIALYLGSLTGTGYVYTPSTVYYYNKVTFTSGVMSSTSVNIAVCKYTYVTVKDGVKVDSTYRYVYCTGNSITAKKMQGTIVGDSTTSAYFLTQSTSSMTITTSDLNNSYAIVGPQSKTS